MSTTADHTSHPSWCDGTHETHVHRVEVGTVEIDDRTASVVILQVPRGRPSLAVSAPGLYVELQVDDHSDAAWLFSRLGRGDLADLIDRAARLLADAERAERVA